MFQTHRPIMTHSTMLLFKWLLVFVPPITVIVGYGLLGHAVGHHLLGIIVDRVQVNLLVGFLLLSLTYVFAETLFGILGRLQTEALDREQDILTMKAVMQERARLSRELHDGVAQLVADLLVRLDVIKDLVESNRQPEAEAELERLHGVADEIYEDIGESIAGLRTNVMERGLIGALQDYADQFEERHAIHTRFQTDEAADRLSLPAALQIFRVIQEALTNVRKHAGAQEIWVTLTASGRDQLRVVIADNGQGFSLDRQKNSQATHLGLTGMRERIEALGGIFRVNSQPGSGTQVTATIPIPRTRREAEYAAHANPAG